MEPIHCFCLTCYLCQFFEIFLENHSPFKNFFFSAITPRYECVCMCVMCIGSLSSNVHWENLCFEPVGVRFSQYPLLLLYKLFFVMIYFVQDLRWSLWEKKARPDSKSIHSLLISCVTECICTLCLCCCMYSVCHCRCPFVCVHHSIFCMCVTCCDLDVTISKSERRWEGITMTSRM